MNKRGQIGFFVTTIYRVLMLIIVVVTVLGISSFVYPYHVDVRDSEAMILSREIVDCVVDEGVINLDKLKGVESAFIYCGFNEEKMKPFFVSVVVRVEGRDDFRIDGGDSNLIWIRDVIDRNADSNVVERYKSGYYKIGYDVGVLDGGVKMDGKIYLEAIVNEE